MAVNHYPDTARPLRVNPTCNNRATHRAPRVRFRRPRSVSTDKMGTPTQAERMTAIRSGSPVLTHLALEGVSASRHQEEVQEGALACPRRLRLPPRRPRLLSCPGSHGCALPHASSSCFSSSSPFCFLPPFSITSKSATRRDEMQARGLCVSVCVYKGVRAGGDSLGGWTHRPLQGQWHTT